MSWAAVGASRAGSAHARTSAPCQDAHQFQVSGAWLIVVVADGAGSASHAQIGAALACQGLASRAAVDPASLIERERVVILFGEVRDALIAEALRLGVRPRELACTALLAVVGPQFAAFAQIGDGAIVFGTRDRHAVAFWPEPSGYANATDFLTDDEFADTLLFETWRESVTELAVLTDGLQRLALDFAEKKPHASFFRPLFDALDASADPEALAEPLAAFLDSPRVVARTDDDKTLVLGVRCR